MAAREKRRTRAATNGVVGTLITAITALVVIVAVILVAHIAFAVFGGNPHNTIVQHLGSWARTLAWEFRDLFSVKDAKVSTIVNYGLAAVVYVALGLLLVRLLRRAQR